MKILDKEGIALLRACAYARLLHDDDGPVVRKLQANLAKVCKVYATRRWPIDVEGAIDMIERKIAVWVEDIRKDNV